MTVRVLAFARARELLSADHVTLNLAEGACVRDAWAALLASAPALRDAGVIRIARNGRVADPDDALSPGDELALLPPVGGG